MDRFDEAKHVRPMSPEDDVRSLDRDTHVTRDTVVSRDADMVRSTDTSFDSGISREADLSRDADIMPAHHVDVDRDTSRPPDEDMPKREGDILGLGGVVVPKDSNDPTTEYDEESVARRRARSGAMDAPLADPNMSRGSGAAGIDMGSGGNGTDIE